MQIDLFDNNKTNNETLAGELAKNILGLELYPTFISIKEEKELLKFVDDSNWLNDLKRRVQHYGYKYDYRARKINNTSFSSEESTMAKGNIYSFTITIYFKKILKTINLRRHNKSINKIKNYKVKLIISKLKKRRILT